MNDFIDISPTSSGEEIERKYDKRIDPSIYTEEPYSFICPTGPIDESSLKPNWMSQDNKIVSFEGDNSVNVFDVAAYILLKMAPMSTMKLQKLVYYCQAWSLVWDEEPLFNEQIEAWANGPVIRDLFMYHRGQFKIDNINIGNPDCLSPNQKETIDAVLKFYGNKSSQWLIDLSHSELPWKEARKGMTDLKRGNNIISFDLIANYYSSLLGNND